MYNVPSVLLILPPCLLPCGDGKLNFPFFLGSYRGFFTIFLRKKTGKNEKKEKSGFSSPHGRQLLMSWFGYWILSSKVYLGGMGARNLPGTYRQFRWASGELLVSFWWASGEQTCNGVTIIMKQVLVIRNSRNRFRLEIILGIVRSFSTWVWQKLQSCKFGLYANLHKNNHCAAV